METLNEERSIFGGKLADIPAPYVRWFDTPRPPRRVKAYIMRYYCAGSRHYYVDFSIEGDPLWNAAEGAWQTSWDDPQAHEQNIGHARKFDNYAHARRLLDRVLRRFFPADKWRRDVDYGEEGPTGGFFYAHPGD